MLTLSKVYHRRKQRPSNKGQRAKIGSQITEFGVGLVILFVFILIPLLDFIVVPMRWMMAQELINNYARKLAMCETLSQSYATMEADPSMKELLRRIGGVGVQSIDMHIKISRSSLRGESESYIANQPGRIPASWLPNAENPPQLFSLEVNVQANMFPAILVPGLPLPIPGISAPIPMTITATHEWGNLGRNPRSGNFYINE